MSCGSGTNRRKKRGKRAENCENVVLKQKSIILKGLILFKVLMQQVFMFQVIKVAYFIVFLERCFHCPFQDLGEKANFDLYSF